MSKKMSKKDTKELTTKKTKISKSKLTKTEIKKVEKVLEEERKYCSRTCANRAKAGRGEIT